MIGVVVEIEIIEDMILGKWREKLSVGKKLLEEIRDMLKEINGVEMKEKIGVLKRKKGMS